MFTMARQTFHAGKEGPGGRCPLRGHRRRSQGGGGPGPGPRSTPGPLLSWEASAGRGARGANYDAGGTESGVGWAGASCITFARESGETGGRDPCGFSFLRGESPPGQREALEFLDPVLISRSEDVHN